MNLRTFTVSCPRCGASHRGLGLLQAVEFLGGHGDALLIADETYDRLLADVLDAAEEILA